MGKKRFIDETADVDETNEQITSNDNIEIEENDRKKQKTKKPLPPGYVCNACGKKDDHAIYDCPSKLSKKQFEQAGKSNSKTSAPIKKKEEADTPAEDTDDKEEIKSWSLFISGLPFDTNKVEFLKFIKEKVEMDNLSLNTRNIILLNFPDNPNRCNGLGYLNCNSEEEYNECISKLNGQSYGKLALSVVPSSQPRKTREERKNKPKPKKEKDATPKCYRCGQAHEPKTCTNPRICYRCRGTDHLSNACPQKKK